MKTQSSYDKKTREFFDSYLPEYPMEWFDRLLDFVKKTSSPDSSVVDLACGAGNILYYFREKTKIKRCVGIDIATELVDIARKKYGIEAIEASIFDEKLYQIVGSDFDYAMLGQVLHHLVGNTRNQSKANARMAIIQALRLIRPNGYLLIHEPTYDPSISGDLIFGVKRILTRFFSVRVNVLKKYHNIGAPLVSFLTPRELKKIIEGIPNCRVVGWWPEVWEVSWLMRFGLILHYIRLSCVVQKLPNRIQEA